MNIQKSKCLKTQLASWRMVIMLSPNINVFILRKNRPKTIHSCKYSGSIVFPSAYMFVF